MIWLYFMVGGIRRTGEELNDCVSEEETRLRLELIMGLVPEEGQFWVGGDLGYTNDPSGLTIWCEDEEGVMCLVVRFHVEHVSYPVLAEMIALVDHYYNPEGIGIDNGGNGLSVVQDLTTLDKFNGHDFETKVMGFDFVIPVFSTRITKPPVGSLRDFEYRHQRKEFGCNEPV